MDSLPTPLSALLRAECDKRGLSAKAASAVMGQTADNAVSRWLTLEVIPSEDQWPAIADFLGMTELEVATAAAVDRIERRTLREIAAERRSR